MILHIVKCEMCDNQFQFNPLERPYERKAPETWLSVYQSKDIQAQEGWHFCSTLCLHRWTGKSLTGTYELPDEAIA